MTLCVAHRGGAQLAPENTLASFRRALELGIEVVELDVQMSRDGHLIVFHDDRVERVTNGTGNILDLDFAYLRSLNAAAHFQAGWPEQEYIPTLYEALELMKGRSKVFIELKYSERDGQPGRYEGMVEAVLADVSRLAMIDQVVLISFDWELLAQAKALRPEVSTAMIVGEQNWQSDKDDAVEILVTRARALKCEWIDMQYNLLTSDMVQYFHDRGLHVAVWTVNTGDALQFYTAMGVDALTTDRPDLYMNL